MATPEEKKDIFRTLGELRQEVLLLKTELNQIDEQKEAAFQKKEKYNSQIRGLISAIKEDKHERDKLTKEVKEEKGKREEYNKQIKENISNIKSLEGQKEAILKKYKIQNDPSLIKQDIERLEFRIETEAMSFEKEKQLMKSINALRKKYNEAKKVSSVWEKIHELSKAIDNERRGAKDFHNKVQNKAKESQHHHEEMISLSKDVDALKKEETQAFEKFVALKKKFNEVNEKLKEKLVEMSKIRVEVDKTKKETREEKRKKDEDILKTKEEMVNEKLRKGEKLTTEDLLVFQNIKE